MSATSPSPAAPIVVADTSEAFQALQAPLARVFALAHAATCEQARALVQPMTPLVLCGVHFDEGRLYDLLRSLKATPTLAQVPFVVTRIGPGELDEGIYDSVKVATSALGGNGFIDFFRWQAQYGPAGAARRLLERVRALVD